MRFGALSGVGRGIGGLSVDRGMPARRRSRRSGTPQTAEARRPRRRPKPRPRRPRQSKGRAPRKGQRQPTYPAPMPACRRRSAPRIQFDLNWTNHYTGPADGEFSDRSVAAVRAFQKDRGFRETGTLTDGRARGARHLGAGPAERVGWRMVEDRATGAQLGLPTNLATHQSAVRSGTRWQIGARTGADRDVPHPRAGHDARRPCSTTRRRSRRTGSIAIERAAQRPVRA